MSINYAAMTEEEVTFPEFHAKGEIPWLRGQLIFLNFNDRKIACAEYREIYLKNGKDGRRMANEYLKAYVEANGRSDTNGIRKLEGNMPQSMKDRIEKLKGRSTRKSILDMHDERSKK